MKETVVDNLTPLMKQYNEIKKHYKDSILMFRLGDFYELFGEDAIKASPVLGVVLTKRQGIPMCGVPFHSVNNYIAKLLNYGFKIAICEQIEDPKFAKGIVKRDVVRVITPGTIIEENFLDAKKNNFLTAIEISEIKDNFYIGFASVDISTGDFLITQFEDKNLTKIIDELIRISPSEIIARETKKQLVIDLVKKRYKDVHIEFLEDWCFDIYTAEEKIKQIYKIFSLESFGLDIYKHQVLLSCVGALITYLERTHKKSIPKLKNMQLYSLENYMFLDSNCIKNLELIENLYDRTRNNTLLDVIDDTKTSLGARLLRSWLVKPLLNLEEIKKRQSIVEIFYYNDNIRQKIRDKLKYISDIERLTNRITSKNVAPKDLLCLKDSLIIIPDIKNFINELLSSNIISTSEFNDIFDLEELKEIVDLIEKAVDPDAPVDIKKGGVIKKGYNKELDEIRDFYSNSKSWLLKYQQEQRERTQIPNLRVGYTSVFGYYIEITKSNLNLVPKDYIRKQTLKNTERFTTAELKEFEDKIISSEEKILQLEEYIFYQIVDEISIFADKLYVLSRKIALIDVFTNFAEIAKKYNYVKPLIDNSYVIELKSCRHPVIENIIPYGKFIPNDVFLDGDSIKLIVLTGPNMAGKSTYIRQVALCVILAQIGSFVPAEYARIGLVDRIFARIGASDYLAKGLSTFMVEMQETANILNNATDRSLIILDEIGRGTSTYDGISIAWAVADFLVDKNNWKSKHYTPKTLFATHYFELTELEQKYFGVKNYNVAVKEYRDEIVFLYKVIPGCSDKSYGIHVAKLAGIPKQVVAKAFVLLKQLQEKSSNFLINKNIKSEQLEFNLEENFLNKDFFLQLFKEIIEIDINNTTPIEALNKIIKWKEIIGNYQIEEKIKD